MLMTSPAAHLPDTPIRRSRPYLTSTSPIDNW
jgi:hypothetical protein